MTTKEMVRCRKCSQLVVCKNGKWFCVEADTDIQDIPDEECPVEDAS